MAMAFFAGVATVLFALLIWSSWNRTHDRAQRVDITVAAPAVPDLPAPRLPDAPRLPSAPVPIPK